MVIPADLKELYPFESKYMSIDAEQNRLHYVETGHGDEALVCVHGNPTWSFYFRNVLKHVQSVKRIIAFDHMGCGLSDNPKNYDFHLAQHIENLSALIEKLEVKKVHLLLHDWGGAIGCGWAVNNLDTVASITLSNTAAFHSNRIPFRISLCRIPFFGSWWIRKCNGFAWPATFMATYWGLDRIVKKGLLWPYRKHERRIAILKFVEDIPLSINHKSRPLIQEIESKLNKITVPTNIIWGQRDFCFDMTFFKKWLSIFPNSKTTVISDASHYVLEDAPLEYVNHVDKFLERL
ncbi:MAG: alpha/beta fold hydrolase [Zetaproteobacteria bacterium]|nr:alpha/beta fold hydrolase [Zetaproteobacteria bacterium]